MIKFNLKKKKLIYIIIILAVLILLLTILNRNVILEKFDYNAHLDHHTEKRFLINPLKASNRQIPPLNIEDLKINNNSEVIGQWSAPIDWNVTAIHSILLPDETVMTFGTFGIDTKESGKDIRSNKKITITDGTKLERDGGSHQWKDHDVNSGVDFDIWDPKKGVDENSHVLFKQPVVMDAFCSVVRVIDNNRVFILGGNKNLKTNLPDTQNHTMIYDVLNKKFSLSKNLNFKRWYASVVITGDEKMFIFGGEDFVTKKLSTTPEVIDLKNIDQGWKVLTSYGNIVGISFNKTLVMELNNNFRL